MSDSRQRSRSRGSSASARGRVHANPGAGPLRYVDEAAGVEDDGLVDDVLVEVVGCFGGIAGQREALRRLEVDVDRPADPRFVHAPRPDPDAAPRRVVGDPHRLEQAADPSLFHVDDAAGADRDGRGRVGEAVDGLVEANRRLHRSLKRGMLDDVAVGQRLLDHHQVELVEPPQVVRVLERIVAIRVNHERDFRESVPHGADPLDVLALLDLHLDAVVLPGDGSFDGLEQGVLRVLEADTQTRRDLRRRPAQ